MTKVATKDDLDAFEKHVYRDFATKKDLKSLKGEIMVHVDERFDNIDRHFEEVHQDIASIAHVTQTELDKKVDQDHFGAIVANLATKEDINRIINMLDHETKRHEDYMIEQSAVKSQLSRHDRWHHEAAEHSGYVLSTD